MQVRGLEELDGRLLDGFDFCRLAYAIFDRIRAESGGIEELRMLRTPRSKKMIEEILPVAQFIRTRYEPGVRVEVRWKGGNQTHDAFLRFSGAGLKPRNIPTRQFLEVSTAVHPNEYLAREQVNRDGMSWGPRLARRDRKTGLATSEPSVRGYREPEREHIGQIVNVIRAKQAKRYPASTSLLVRVVANMPILDGEWAYIVEEVAKAFTSLRFREVLLLEPVGGRVSSVFFKPSFGRRRPNNRLQPTAAGAIMSHRG